MAGLCRKLEYPGRVRLLLTLCALALLGACTTLPQKEFASYKETFAQARSAGEQVLVDYGAAASQYADVKAQEAAESPSARPRATSFSASDAQSKPDHVDHIGVRMKAWEVVARYNDLLTKLAEGRAADELLGAVDGFSDSLAGFPVAAVKLATAQVQAYLAPLRPLVKDALQEKSRREFVAAVAKGAPYIEDNFLDLLRADAEDYYRVRKGLNDLDYRPLLGAVRMQVRGAGRLAATAARSEDLTESLQKLNARLAMLPRAADDSPAIEALPLPSAGDGGEPSEPALEAIGQATAACESALAKNEELHAYREVLLAHVALLDQLRLSLVELRQAAEQAQPTIPRGEDLRRKVIMLREAYIAYKDKL